MRSIVIVLCLATSAIAAPSVDVVAAPPIDAAPSAGLDPDVVARLDSSEQDAARVAPTALGPVLDRALVVYESDDPFSTAQRDAARPRTLKILGTIGERARAAGEVELAARAFDARWTISGGHRDPELAQVLVTWAERDAEATPGQALYLARRARSADPDQPRAVHLDDDLSHNHRIWSGRLAILAGVVALAAGFYARSRVSAIEDDLKSHARPGDQVDQMLNQRDLYDAVGTGLLIGAPILSFGGIALVLSGQPSYTPSSPAELPMLGAP